VSVGEASRHQYLFESVHGCTIIGTSCVRSADTNNDFWYRLATIEVSSVFT
jgi:hypothetical protein